MSTTVVSKRARALAASIADDGTQRLPQRKFFRQRAHINPMSHQLYEYPIAPARALWSRHFPAFAAPSDPTALVPGLGVRVMDVGCGFGGLTMALAERAPDTLVLGLEIRPKVTEYVRLRIQAHRRKGMEALGGSGGAGAGAGAGAAPQPHPSSSHHNASVLKSNAMKYLPCLTPKASLTQLFFCFADPQFKPANHRRRIVNTQLLAEYAYALREGGRLYFITDVPDLFNWMEAHTAAHPLFARLPPQEEASDPAVALMWDATEESQKVAREGRRENVRSAVWVRVSEEEGRAREAALKKEGGGGWWDDIPIDYTYTPSAGQLSKGKSRDWRGVIASGPEVAAEDFAKAQALAAETKAVNSRSARRAAAAAAATAAAAAVTVGEAGAAAAAGGGGLVLPFGRTATTAPEGDPPLPPGAFFAPASRRNAGPIEGELRRILSTFPSGANVLELACGSGQHAAHFVSTLGGGLVKSWQATDKEESGCASANAYREALAPEHKALLLPARVLDAEMWGLGGEKVEGSTTTTTSPPSLDTTGKYDCVLAVNVLHISPLATTTGVLRGAAQALAPGGVLVIYGPFTRNGEFTTPSNQDFDRQLKDLSPEFGLRDLDAHVFQPGVALGLIKEGVVDMPANNFLLVLRKQ
jgi:tRNA (guanine-N7-)-methyltransferase